MEKSLFPTPKYIVDCNSNTDQIADDLYNLFRKMQRCGDMEFFQTILLTE